MCKGRKNKGNNMRMRRKYHQDFNYFRPSGKASIIFKSLDNGRSRSTFLKCHLLLLPHTDINIGVKMPRRKREISIIIWETWGLIQNFAKNLCVSKKKGFLVPHFLKIKQRSLVVKHYFWTKVGITFCFL